MRYARLLLASGLGFCVVAVACAAALYLVTTKPGRDIERPATFRPGMLWWSLAMTQRSWTHLMCVAAMLSGVHR
jgi:hypothetical protein